VKFIACSITVLVLLTACAATPRPTPSLQSNTPIQTPPPSQALPVVATTAPAAGASTPSAAAPAVTPAADADAKALEKQARALGYKPQVHQGTQYFCRVGTPTGSLIPVNECITPHALETQLAAQSAAKYRMPTNTACLSASCKGS
jgi:hypothetical protein